MTTRAEMERRIWLCLGVLATVAIAAPATANAAIGFTPAPQSPLAGGSPGDPVALEVGAYRSVTPDDDVAVGYATGTSIDIYVGSSGEFREDNIQSLTVGSGPHEIASDDFDQDGDDDLAVISDGSNQLHVIRNDSPGSLVVGAPVALADPVDIVVGQFNAGTDADLAIVNRGADTVSIMLGAAGETFSGPTNFAAGDEPVQVAAADVNQNSNQDLLVATRGATDELSTLSGNGSGGFAAPASVGTIGPFPADLDAANLDGNADPDVVLSDSFGAASPLIGVVVFRGASGSTFSAPVTLAGTANGVTASEIGDFDGDGDPDILAGEPRSSISNQTDRQTALDVFINDGTGVFSLGARDVGEFEHSISDLAVIIWPSSPADNEPSMSVFVADPGALTASPDPPLRLFHRGVSSRTPAALAFGSVEQGRTGASQAVTYTNTDGPPIEVENVRTTGANPDDFLIANDGCTNTELSAGESCTVGVRLAPITTGARAASLVIRDDVPRFTGPDTVALSGTGTAPVGGPPGSTGATGSQGAPGATGSQGPAGASGTPGATGATGSTGGIGPAGTPGAQGAIGPQGPPGEDAQVTCKVTKPKGRKPPKVKCTVTPVAGRMTARLVRNGHVAARSTPESARDGRIDLAATDHLGKGGRYTLVLVTRSASGDRTVSTFEIGIGGSR